MRTTNHFDLLHIAVVASDVEVRKSIVSALRAASPLWRVIETDTSAKALDVVIRDTPAIMICDEDLASRPGSDVLAEARALHPDIVGILLVSAGSSLSTINLAGVFRSLKKPVTSHAELISAICDAESENRRRLEVQAAIFRSLATLAA